MAKKAKGVPSNKEIIVKSWEGTQWPPAVGGKVKIFLPKDSRGQVAKVVASGDAAAKKVRPVTGNKIRVQLGKGEEAYQRLVAQTDVFPSSVKLKDIEKQINPPVAK